MSAVRHYDDVLAVGVSATSAESCVFVSDLIVQLRDVMAVGTCVFLGGGAITSEAAAHELGADEWAPDARSFVAALDLAASSRNKARRTQGSIS